MPRDTATPQEITAIEHTKRGYGLWRGEVIHPDDPRMDAIIASGDPITDTKGFGLRYVPVRGAGRVAHFRAHDPEMLGKALDAAFPSVHDAVVRLVAEDIRAGGYDALVRWCAAGSLPERFEVAEVTVEKDVRASGKNYRPDISVWHSEGGRVELEVVNTHPPDGGRLKAAWGEGHFVLTLGIRDVVEKIVFSESRGVVPEDTELRALLGLRRFRLCGGEGGARDTADVVWRDLNLSAYAMQLRAELRKAYWTDQRFVVVPFTTCICTTFSEVDDSRDVMGEFYGVLHSHIQGHKDAVAGSRWVRHVRSIAAEITQPHPSLDLTSKTSETFLDSFSLACREPPGVRRLRYALCAVWHIRLQHLILAAHFLESILFCDAPHERNNPLHIDERGIK